MLKLLCYCTILLYLLAENAQKPVRNVWRTPQLSNLQAMFSNSKARLDHLRGNSHSTQGSNSFLSLINESYYIHLESEVK